MPSCNIAHPTQLADLNQNGFIGHSVHRDSCFEEIWSGLNPKYSLDPDFMLGQEVRLEVFRCDRQCASTVAHS